MKDGIHLKIHILRGRSFEGGAHYKIFTSRGRSFEGGAHSRGGALSRKYGMVLTIGFQYAFIIHIESFQSLPFLPALALTNAFLWLFHCFIPWKVIIIGQGVTEIWRRALVPLSTQCH